MTDGVLRIRRDRASWLEVDGETVLLDVASGRYLGVNRTGSLLWSHLDTGATREELVATLTDAYGLDPERAGADVDAFLALCAEHGFLA